MSERLHLGTHLPLRILTNQDTLHGRTLNTPYEIAPHDNVTIEHLKGDRQIALITLVSTPISTGSQAFERHLLLSSWKDQQNWQMYLLTLSGYEFDGDVEVKAWKDYPDYKGYLDTNERQRMSLIRRLHGTKITHIQGLEKATAMHKDWATKLGAQEITLDEAQKIYEAILYTVPRS